MTYLLSICIPTYNRADMLRQTINSILAQDIQGVEIIVSDNASTDGTDALMKDMVVRHPQICYLRSDSNVGADRNFLKAVDLASGSYAWLMSSDDLLAPGSIEKVLLAIAEHPSLPGFSVNRQMYDLTMTQALPDMDLFTPRADVVHVYESALEVCDELGVYLSFISGQILRKDSWNRHARQPNISKYYNGLVHLFILYSMIRDAGTWGAIAAPVVHCRSGNDSFLNEGYIKRFKIDVIGFSDAAGDVFGRESRIYRVLVRKMLRNLLVNRVIGFKLGRVRGIYFKSFLAALPVCWREARFWGVFVPMLLMPAAMIHCVLDIRRRIKRAPST